MVVFNDFYEKRLHDLNAFSENLQRELERGDYSFTLRKEYKTEHKLIQKEIALLKWIKSELDNHQKLMI